MNRRNGYTAECEQAQGTKITAGQLLAKLARQLRWVAGHLQAAALSTPPPRPVRKPISSLWRDEEAAAPTDAATPTTICPPHSGCLAQSALLPSRPRILRDSCTLGPTSCQRPAGRPARVNHDWLCLELLSCRHGHACTRARPVEVSDATRRIHPQAPRTAHNGDSRPTSTL